MALSPSSFLGSFLSKASADGDAGRGWGLFALAEVKGGESAPKTAAREKIACVCTELSGPISVGVLEGLP